MLLDLIRSGFSRERLVSILLSLPCILFALTFHEVSHGYAAYRLGDSTARNFGRLTLNPVKHLDPVGFFCMLLFGFGWAKPVPVNTRNFRKPRSGMALTAAAGPAANLLLGLLSAMLCRGIFELSVLLLPRIPYSWFFNLSQALYLLFYVFSILNFSLGLFNLIPVPPFDGSRILFVFLPDKWYFALMKYERYIMLAVLLLFSLNILSFNISTVTDWLFNLGYRIFYIF